MPDKSQMNRGSYSQYLFFPMVEQTYTLWFCQPFRSLHTQSIVQERFTASPAYSNGCTIPVTPNGLNEYVASVHLLSLSSRLAGSYDRPAWAPALHVQVTGFSTLQDEAGRNDMKTTSGCLPSQQFADDALKYP